MTTATATRPVTLTEGRSDETVKSLAIDMTKTRRTEAEAVTRVSPAFVLLFAVAPTAAGVPDVRPTGPVWTALGETNVQAYREQVEGSQRRLLGNAYLAARRLEREPVGRLALPSDGTDVDDLAPQWADVWRVRHKSGACVWEVWLQAPVQTMDAARLIRWLDREDPGSLASRIWSKLSHDGPAPEFELPLTVLLCEGGARDLLAFDEGQSLIQLLHRDRMHERFKAGYVQEQLSEDFCRREDGLSLLSRRGAIDIHTLGPDSKMAWQEHPVPRNSLPLLLTLELLSLERAVLRGLLNRFAAGSVSSIDALLALRADMIDGLEEYYGTLAQMHGYMAEVTARGEELFGIDDLFDSATDRLEAITFEITTRNQQTVNHMGFWLTILFGAIETGFLASSLATWYYVDNLLAVLSWTLGATVVTAITIALLLRRLPSRRNPR